jgi:hypothetical protein
VQGDEYLLKLSRYIHLNPVFVRALRSAPIGERVRALRAYRWSSYREYLGIDSPIGFLETAPLLRLVGGSTGDRPRLYGHFVETGLAVRDDEFRALLKSSRWGIGDAEFRECLADLNQCRVRQARRPEDVAFRQAQVRRSTEEVLRVVAAAFGLTVERLRERGYGCPARGVAARMLWVYAGLNQRDIGQELRMGTGSAVCQQLRTLELARAGDENLDQRLRQIEERLSLNS